jgi:16S rRNA (cytosine967-C5)-methyltransferase
VVEFNLREVCYLIQQQVFHHKRLLTEVEKRQFASSQITDKQHIKWVYNLNRCYWRHFGIATTITNAWFKTEDPTLRYNVTSIVCMAMVELYVLAHKDHAVVYEWVEVAKKHLSPKLAGTINALLRNLAREESMIKLRLNKCSDHILPISWQKKLESQYPSYNNHWINKQPQTDITIFKQEVAEQLLKSGIVAHNYQNNYRLIDNTLDIPEITGYDNGDFIVQDLAASLAVNSITDFQGCKILDIGSAPGGKTAQLAKKFPRAEITCLDISKSRMSILHENMTRLKISNVNPVCVDALKYRTTTKFDLIILDSPCSSSGTMRRHPELPWIKPCGKNNIAKFTKLQYDLLKKAYQLLSDNGTLIYAVCSLLREEGEDIISRFYNNYHDINSIPVATTLKSGIKASTKGSLRTTPWLHDLDGFFIAKFSLKKS